MKVARKVMLTGISTIASTEMEGKVVDKHVDNVDNSGEVEKVWVPYVYNMFMKI